MAKWIEREIEEDQRREAKLEEFKGRIEPFLTALAKRVWIVVDQCVEYRPELKRQIHVKPNKPCGILVTRTGPKGQTVVFRVIPESRVLQWGVLKNGELEGPLEFPLKPDDAGKLALEDNDWDSLLQRCLKPILFPNF